MNWKIRFFVALCLIVPWAVPAIADLNYTEGDGVTRNKTLFDFICFTSKHCSAHVQIKSDGTEIFTSSNPAQVTGANGTFPVTGTFWQATQPVSAVSWPLPTGAATQTTTAAILAALNGGLPAALGAGGGLKIDGSGTALPVSLASVPSHAVTNAGTFATQSAITAASGAFASGAGVDGWDLTRGTKADAPCTLPATTTACSEIAIAKATANAVNGDVPNVTIGNVAPATATATKALLWGVQYNSTQATFTNGQQGTPQISPRGALYVVPGAEVFTVQPGNTANTTPWLMKQHDGTNARVYDPCETVAHVTTPIDIASAATSVIVAGTSSKKTYICAMMLFAAGTTNVGIVQGSGSTCGTSTLGLIGGNTSGKGPNLTAQAGFVGGNGNFAIAGTTVNANDICLINSAAVQVSGYIVTATP